MDEFNGAEGQATDGGIDVEGQIKQGVEAFMQSQDPAIAVEVVNMLASMMGIAPEVDQFSDQAEAPVDEGVPMGRNGMKFSLKYKSGGSVDPGKKKKGITSTLVPASQSKRSLFTPQDLNSGSIQNRTTTPEMGMAMREDPAKTIKRSRIQAIGLAGGDITDAGGFRVGNNAAYDAKGRSELAGRFTDVNFNIPAVEHTLPPLDPMVRVPNDPATPGIPASEIRQKYGKGPKVRRPRVDYLQGHGYGRNKRTEGGY